ncbi:hypothetical protein GCD22_00100 [Acidithiobacillus thiooxidans ATCC 19377]|uniref:Uncharacterized protein n=1 Tax=Acidithiobacillus thiooxidans ATCC 19377 TaxID=637390 RepID=A0A5P9XL14_ACITH|nr:hypothetical protein GCD22_00100 [Acidithiobacillus thiooxidans ATCC 19377]
MPMPMPMPMPGLPWQQGMFAIDMPIMDIPCISTQDIPCGIATAALLIQVPIRNKDNIASERK